MTIRHSSGITLLVLGGLLAVGCQSNERGESDAAASPNDGAPAAPAPRVSELNPEETVAALLDAFLDKRLGEYYYFVSTTDKEVKSLDSLQAEFAPTAADIITDFLFQQTEVTIDSSTVVGDSALVYVTSRAPPFQFVMQQAHIVERDLGPETDMDTKMSIMAERHRLSGSPLEENPSIYRLVRETGGWRVNVGWAEMEAWLSGE